MECEAMYKTSPNVAEYVVILTPDEAKSIAYSFPGTYDDDVEKLKTTIQKEIKRIKRKNND